MSHPPRPHLHRVPGVTRVWVPCRLRADLGAIVVSAAGWPAEVAGPIGCLDGSAAVLGTWLGYGAAGLHRVRFRGGVEVVVTVESMYAWESAA